LLHHDMIIVDVSYREAWLSAVGKMSGSTSYGASTLAAPNGARQPNEKYLTIARAQSQRVPEIALPLTKRRGWARSAPR
jgi:NAD(P)H dehydrogenase (quinone)